MLRKPRNSKKQSGQSFSGHPVSHTAPAHPINHAVPAHPLSHAGPANSLNHAGPTLHVVHLFPEDFADWNALRSCLAASNWILGFRDPKIIQFG